ncbi:MAG: hypothetical protein P8Y12_01445, partial [Gammaproteobacteria bacterium]
EDRIVREGTVSSLPM